MKKETRRKLGIVLISGLAVIGTGLVVRNMVLPDAETKIVAFQDLLWPEVRYHYFLKGNCVVGHKMYGNDYKTSEFYRYQLETSQAHDLFYRFAQTQGDLSYKYPEMRWIRSDIRLGATEPYNYEFYDNENAVLEAWFAKINKIVFVEGNRMSQPPPFLSETPWLGRVCFGRVVERAEWPGLIDRND